MIFCVLAPIISCYTSVCVNVHAGIVQDNYPSQEFDRSLLDKSSKVMTYVKIARAIPSFNYMKLVSAQPQEFDDHGDWSWALVNLMPCPLVDCTFDNLYASMKALAKLNTSEIKKVMYWFESDSAEYWYSSKSSNACGQLPVFERHMHMWEIGRRAELICKGLFCVKEAFPWKLLKGKLVPDPRSFLQEFEGRGAIIDPLTEFNTAVEFGRRDLSFWTTVVSKKRHLDDRGAK